MRHSAIEKEIFDDHRAYAQAIATMDVPNSAIDLELIRRSLSQEGVVTLSPLVTIPFDLQHMERLAALKESHPWADPSTTSTIDRAYDKCKKRDQGMSVFEVGFPNAFQSSLHQMAIVFDDTELNIKDFGETYTYASKIAVCAHEITHSAFDKLTSKRVKKLGKGTVDLIFRSSITQTEISTTLIKGASAPTDTDPSWIDEGFAVYMSAEIRAKLHPQSVPEEPSIQQWGEREFVFPPKYLAYSEKFPGQPGLLCVSVEGLGFDVLAEKMPELVPQLKGLTTGKVAIESVHKAIKNRVGTELYQDLTVRKPSENWYNVLEQLTDLN